MGNQSSQTVFHNDYLMIEILRTQNLKQQYVLQKVCQRLRYLVIECVWSRDCKEIQMNSVQTGCLTNEEFFDVLQLNAGNVKKLTVDEKDGKRFHEYFAKTYDNLVELRINGFTLEILDYDLIATNCPKLERFHYDKLTGKRLKSVECHKNDLWSLATKTPIQYINLSDVVILKREQVQLPNIKTLKIYNCLLNHCSESLKFLGSCFNLQDLDIATAHSLKSNFCDNCPNLEKVCISRTMSLRTLWRVMNLKKLKHLVFRGNMEPDTGNTSLRTGQNVGKSLESLTVHQSVYTNIVESEKNIWLTIFQSSKTNFENLQELCMQNQFANDELIELIAMKCPQLITLRLSLTSTTGRYMNNITKLKCLEICSSRQKMPLSYFQCILRDLKFLEYLNLDQHITYGEFSNHSAVQYYAKSLKVLKIHANGEQLSFWQKMFKFCHQNLIQCLHTFEIIDCSDLDEMVFQNLLSNFQHLESLQLTRCKSSQNRNYCFDKMPSIKNLIFSECEINITWSNIMELLKYSKLQSLAILKTTIYNMDISSPLEETKLDIFTHLRSLTIPYTIFKQKLSFWQRFFEHRPHFQLCCFDHCDQRTVLYDFFQNVSMRNKVTSIHVNVGLKITKNYLVSTIGTLIASVCWLDVGQLDIGGLHLYDRPRIIVIKK